MGRPRLAPPDPHWAANSARLQCPHKRGSVRVHVTQTGPFRLALNRRIPMTFLHVSEREKRSSRGDDFLGAPAAIRVFGSRERYQKTPLVVV